MVVLGASDKPDRYSYKAVELLREKGCNPIPVHPRVNSVNGVPTRSFISDVSETIDTVTLYINAKRSSEIADDIIAKKPARVIFNPGAENHDLMKKCEDNGIEAVAACTLVLLRTGQF